MPGHGLSLFCLEFAWFLESVNLSLLQTFKKFPLPFHQVSFLHHCLFFRVFKEWIVVFWYCPIGPWSSVTFQNMFPNLFFSLDNLCWSVFRFVLSFLYFLIPGIYEYYLTWQKVWLMTLRILRGRLYPGLSDEPQV